MITDIITLKGFYLLLIMTGPPQMIGVKQMVSPQLCIVEKEKAIAEGQYAYVECIQNWSISSLDVDLPPLRRPRPLYPLPSLK